LEQQREPRLQPHDVDRDGFRHSYAYAITYAFAVPYAYAITYANAIAYSIAITYT
jgi:hypothetical protein